MTRTFFALAVSLAACLLAAACDQKPASNAGGQVTPDNPSSYLGKSAKLARDTAGGIEGQQAATMAAAQDITGEGERVRVAGLSFAVPGTWTKVQGAGGGTMAPVAEYRIDGQDGAAQLKFFSAGGSADANINRWKGQMKEDDGSPSRAQPATRTIAGVKVITLEMEGTYTGMAAGGAAPPEADTGFLGAIFEGPQGQVQVRANGPYRTIRAIKAQWNAMIETATTGR